MSHVSVYRAIRSKSRHAAYGSILFTMLLWSTAFPGIRHVLQEVDATSMTLMRMGWATLTLVLIGVLFRIPLPKAKDLGPIGLAGLTGFTLYHLSLNTGMTQTPAALSSFLIATGPIWTSLLASKFLSERLTKTKVIGLVLSLLGVIVLAIGQGGWALKPLSLLILVAAWSAAISVVLQKKLLQRYTPLQLTVYMSVAGVLPYLTMLPSHWTELCQISASNLGTLAYLGVGPVALGFLCNCIALRTLPASQVAQMLLVVPPLSAIWAWFFLGEKLTQSLYIGGLFILAGVFISNVRPQNTNPTRN